METKIKRKSMCERVCTLVEQSEVFSLESVYVCECILSEAQCVCGQSYRHAACCYLLHRVCASYMLADRVMCVCVMVE